MRSVGLIIVASWFCNFSFEMAVLRKPITFAILRKILTFEIVYWDFLATFPAMLLVAFLTTKPLMSLAASAGKTSIKRMMIFVLLLVWPLLTPRLALETCRTPMEIYATLFIGCTNRTMGAMRFSAFTYMFFFNFGCIVSLLTLEYSRSSADRAISLPSVREIFKSPTWLGFIALFLVELYFAIPVFGHYNRSWEYLNWNGYRRFPMTTPLILAWGFMSQCVGIFSLTFTGVMNKLNGTTNVFTRVGKSIISVLEHFGANVLLYLTISNIVIHGFFHVDWTRYFKPSDKKKEPSMYTNFQWELMVVAVAIGQILLTRLIVYLIRTSRK